MTNEQLLISTIPQTYGEAEQLYFGFLRARWLMNNPEAVDESDLQYEKRVNAGTKQVCRNLTAAMSHFLAMRGLDRSAQIAETSSKQADVFSSWLRRFRGYLEKQVATRSAQNYQSELNRWFVWLTMPRVTDDLPKFFGSALQVLISRSGLLKVQVAEKAGVKYNTLRSWASGRTEPRGCHRESIEKLEKEFSVVPGTLTNRSRWMRRTCKRVPPTTAAGKQHSALCKLKYTLHFDDWPEALRNLFETLYLLTEPGRRTGRSDIRPPGRWSRRRNGRRATRGFHIASLSHFFGFLSLSKDEENPYLRGYGLTKEDLTFDVLADFDLIDAYFNYRALRAGYVAGRVLTSGEKLDPTSIRGKLPPSMMQFNTAVQTFIRPVSGLLPQTATACAREIRERVRARAADAGIKEEQWTELAQRTAADWATVEFATQAERDHAAVGIGTYWAEAAKVPVEQWAEIIKMPAGRWAERVSVSSSAEVWRRACENTSRRLARDAKEAGAGTKHKSTSEEKDVDLILKQDRPVLAVIRGVQQFRSELPDIDDLLVLDDSSQERRPGHAKRRIQHAMAFQQLALAEMSTAVQLRPGNWRELTIAEMTMADGSLKKRNLTLNENGSYHLHIDHRDFKIDKDAAEGDFDIDLPLALSPTLTTLITHHRPLLVGPESPFLFRNDPGTFHRELSKGRSSKDLQDLRVGPISAGVLRRMFKDFTRVYLNLKSGFGIYEMRHIAATDYVKNHPGSFLVAATMLHNTVQVIIKHYAHLCDQDTFRQWTAYYEVLIQDAAGPKPEDLARVADVPYNHLGAVWRAASGAIAQDMSLRDFARMLRKAYEEALAEQYRPNASKRAAA
jgi:hypothetical protein